MAAAGVAAAPVQHEAAAVLELPGDYDDYLAGRLDIMAFLAFSLAPLARHPRARLDAWHAQFMAEKIEPLIGPAALDLVQRHREAGG